METITKSQGEEILKRLMKLQVDVEYLKSNMLDADCVLTDKEKEELKEAEGEYERGETTSLEDFEKEMKLIRKKK